MFYIILIALIELALFAANYIHGTYLLGWDNVMPEFNLWLNFKRALFSVWQEYRGLGLLDGMAHSANLFHTLYIALLSFFLPQSVLRYVFIFLTHLAGGLAMFSLLKHLLGQKKPAFIGALFYMFNLGVIQMYYAPLEVFSVHFAALPAVALFLTKALKKTTSKNLLFLFLVLLLTTPQGFVPTVFFASFILFSLILLFHFLETRSLKKIIVIGFIFLSANAFWLLPYVYSANQNAKIIPNTRINQFSSEEIFYRNYAKGDFFNVLSLNGFMIDAIDFNKETNSSQYFMQSWKKYQETLFYKSAYGLFFSLGFLGIIIAVKKRKKGFFPYLLAFLVSFVFLANRTLFLEQINSVIRILSPTFAEAFRFPFTKFITLFAFCFSVFIALGASTLLNYFSASKGQAFRSKTTIIFFLLVSCLLFLSFPAFKGYFISPFLKINLPQSYLQAFQYFDSLDENQRVAVFPITTFWNWQHRSFGQRGSGFLWYGIKQPLLERAFDPWSLYNEQFFNEISYSLKADNQMLFEQVLKKYDIKYIFLDQYVREVSYNQPINYDRLKDFLKKSRFLQREIEFGKIIVYKTNVPNPWLYSLNSEKTVSVFPSFSSEFNDTLNPYGENYIVNEKKPKIIPVFPSLSSQKLQENLEIEVIEDINTITLKPKIKFADLTGKNYLLEIPSVFNDEFLIPIKVDFYDNQLVLAPLNPKILLDGQKIESDSLKFIIRPKKIKEIASATFVDINHEIKNTHSENPKKSYLLGNFLNSIKLKDNQSNEEIIFFDTNELPKSSSSFLQLKDIVFNEIIVVVDKIQSPFSLENIIENNGYEIKDPLNLLNSFKNNNSFAKIGKENKKVSFEIKGTAKDLTFYNDSLFHQTPYILLIKANYFSGLPINFYLDNNFENRPEFETRLSKTKTDNVVFIPKTEEYFKGYGFHFVIKSIKEEVAKSSIEKISLYPFPSNTLKNIRIIAADLKKEQFTAEVKWPIEFKKIGNFIYESNFVTSQDYLVLSQAFDKGWKAYQVKNYESGIMNYANTYFPFFFGEEIKEHVLVNNWENGWNIEKSNIKNQISKIAIVYLPQYIQYVGFILLIGTIFGLILFSFKKK